jgi:hypothetical protein
MRSHRVSKTKVSREDKVSAAIRAGTSSEPKKRRISYTRVVAFCRVSYRDLEEIEHAAEVTAESLYEAVALTVARFRRDDRWAMSPLGPGCEFQVRVMPDSPVMHSIPLKKVETFALHERSPARRTFCARSAFGNRLDLGRLYSTKTQSSNFRVRASV